MKRTNRIIEACQAQGVELPSEWFARDDGRMCASCAEVWYPKDKHIFACSCDGMSVEVPRGSYIGPDLALPSNLHEALRLAVIIAGKCGRLSLQFGAKAGKNSRWFFDMDQCGGDDLYGDAFASMHNIAVLAAVEKALGLPEWKEPTP